MWIDPQVLKLWKRFWINYVLHPSTPYFQTNPGWGRICPKSLGVHHKGSWDHVYPSLWSGLLTIKLDQIGNIPILDTLCIYIYTNQIPQVYQPDPTSLLAAVISSMASWELTAVSNCSAFEASHRVKNCGVSQKDKLGSLRSARFENSQGVHHPFSHIILLPHPPETAV